MPDNKPTLVEVIKSLKEYQGILRKGHSWMFREIVGEFFGEDAGFMSLGEHEVVLTTDGIWEKVIEADLEWAGFVSILVNVHDIYAMGAKPVMAVNVISAKSSDDLKKILSGIERGIRLFGIKMVKGHLHPESSRNSIDVAMVGIGKREKLLRSNTAKSGDEIVIAVDTDGQFHEKLPYNFDSTSKPRDIFIRQFESMIRLAEEELVSSAKDLSNAGILGTAAMLLEVSNAGGIIDLDKIPTPDGADIIQWLKCYPACGFVCTAENGKEAVKIFRKHSIEAEIVGEVDDSKLLRLKLGNEEGVFYDFRREGVLGIWKKRQNYK